MRNLSDINTSPNFERIEHHARIAPKRPRVGWIATTLVLCALAMLSASAVAATFTVSNLSNSGSGSLRQAIMDANNNGTGADTIVFQAGVTGTVNLTSRLPAFSGATTVNGPGATALTVNGGSFTIFNVVNSANVQMSGLRVTGGAPSVGLNSSQLEIDSGTVAVSNSAFENAGGVAVASFGTLAMTNVTIANPMNLGLFNGGNLTLTNVTISGAGSRAIEQNGGLVSTTLINCTIANNGDSAFGAPVYAGNNQTLILKNSILANNAGAQINIVQLGGPPFNLISQGNNLISDNSLTSTAAGDLLNTNPLLDELANYGGSTRTRALRPGSPAINAGSASGAPSTDQRGFARVGATDIGAFESQGFTLALAAGNNQSTGTSTNFASPLSVTASYVNGGTINSGQVTFTPPGSGASATIAGNPATITNGSASTGTVTANATAGGPYTVSASMPGVTAVNFSLTNTQVNTPPTISNVVNQAINEDTTTGALAVTIGDGQTAAASLTMSGSSNNTILVPNANIVFGGSGANRTVTVTPVAGRSGTATITLTVTDGNGSSASDTFLLTVNPVNDPPSFTAGANQTRPSGTNTNQSVSGWATSINDGDPDFTQALTFNVSNNNNSLFSVQPQVAANGTLTFTPTGAPGVATVSVSLTDDATAGGPALTTAVQTFTITISPPSVSIAVLPASVLEDGAASLVYTVTRSANFPSSTLVNITTTGTATAGTDYTGGVSSVTIPAGATTATITINPTADSVVEPDETVILTVAPGSGYTVSTPAGATGTILNDDVPTATIAVAPASVAENGATNLIYTVTLNQAAFSPTSVNFSVGGTATSGSDYAPVTAPLLIPTGNSTGTIAVNPTGDTTIEADETVIITLAAGSGYTVGAPASATGTILNDDLPNLTINDVTAAEGNAGTTNFTFTVSLSAPAGPGGVSFDIATANGTATAGVDYVAQSLAGQTISAGSSTYTFTVLVNGELLNETNETFFVNLTSVTGAVVLDGQGVGTISNDDPLPSLSIDDISVIEGNVGTVNAVFTLMLSAASGQTVDVNYATANGTATQPADYTSASGTLSFMPGQLTRTITVAVNGDALLEGDETFLVNLSGASNATIADPQGVGTIVDDELPGMSINDVSIAEGNAGTSVLNFTVTRTGATASAVGFSFATADGIATTADSDYVTASGTGTIAGGGATGTTTVSVTINGDGVFENSESFVVNLTAPTNAVITDAQGVGIITNDDAAPTLAINDVSILEGDSGTQSLVFTVTRSGQTALPASFSAAPADGTATAPSDYAAGLAGGTAIAPGGATGTTTLSLPIIGDNVVEVDETLFVNLTAPVNATIADNQGIGTILNDDFAGLAIVQSGGTTTVTEGGATDSYTVALTSQPNSSVSVTLTGTQVTASPTPLSFTSGNWSTPQTVTVTAINDAIAEGTHAGSVGFAITSGDSSYNALAVPDVAVSITDNDTVGIIVTPTAGLVTTEAGGTATFSVRLDSQPTADVIIGLSSSDTSEGTVLPTSLTFTAVNWNTVQTVTVTGVDDAVVDGDIAYSIITAPATSADPNYGGVNPADVSLSNTDNDSAAIEVTPTSGLVTTEAGGTATFTMRLSSQPTANVVIGLSSSDTSEGTVLPASLTFTAVNWNTLQTVTVSGVDDFEVDGDIAYSIITAPATSADPNYGGVNPSDVSVINTDNDSASVTVTQSGANTAVTEGGATDSFTVVLTSQPSSAVSMVLSGTQVTANPTPLSFTSGNWNVAQTVTVTAIDDAIAEGTHAGSVGFAITSSDSDYNGLALTDVAVSITDNDSAGILVTPTAGLVTTEAGGTATFSVRLGSQPTADVVIGLSSSDTGEGMVLPTPLTFTAVNWNTVQTVTVTGVDDAVDDGDIGYNIITAPASSTDPTYGGFNAADVSVSNADNDNAGISVTPTAGLVTTEAGGTATFTVRLDSQPTANVVIGLSSSDTSEGTVLPASLTFTAVNWNALQTVTLTGVDDFVVDGDIAYSIVTGPATSADPNYVLNAADVSVSNTDNDTPGVTVVQSDGNTAVTEGGATDTITVVLNSQPTGTVSVAMAGTQVSAAPTPLSFTIGNWNVAQTVTVTAIDDAIAEGTHSGSVAFALTSSDSNYNALVVPSIAVAITDNDNAGVAVSPISGLVSTEAGGTASFTVALTSEPTANVVIGLSSSDTTEGTVSPASLTFSAANWNTPQTVTVTGADDSIVDGDSAYSIVTAAATSTDSNYSVFNPDDVSVTNTDDDVRGITVTETGGDTAVTEGGATDTISVVLTSEPTANVSIALTGTQVTPTPTPLVFTSANWNVAQTITVTAIDDALFETDPHPGSVSFVVSSGDAGYAAIMVPNVTVSVTDNDSAPVISITSPSQTEGNTGSSVMNFEVSLSAASSLPVTFNRATADGSAMTGNNDYVAIPSGPLTIPAGQQMLTIPVTINGDTVFEGDETFSVVLSAINGATPTTITGIGTIEEDDQQPTTTTITGDLPDPSVVGQPYTVSVDVVASSSSPLGTVTVSDGTDSCGPVTLVAGTSPSSSASCDLISTTVGSKNLVASYVPASTAFAASVSAGVAHLVDPTSTTISVAGPPRSRINQPTSFSFDLAAVAPGGGSPAGTVVLSSGASSCIVTVPTATPSCALSFSTLGSRTISAAFTPSDGSYLAANSTPGGDLPTLVYALANLAVSKTDGLPTYAVGDLIVYTVTVRNLGPDIATNFRVRDLVPAGLGNVVWSCDASGGVSCAPNSGSGDLDQLISNMNVGALLNYSYFGNADGSTQQIVNTALVELPADNTIDDQTLGNNSAIDSNLLDELFADGFETAAVNAPSGSFPLPSSALRALIGEDAMLILELDDALGAALRVYARVHDGAMQYALAPRDRQGLLRLQSWQSKEGEPDLLWTSRQVESGWVLESAELR